jgi:hypothetical protein
MPVDGRVVDLDQRILCSHSHERQGRPVLAGMGGGIGHSRLIRSASKLGAAAPPSPGPIEESSSRFNSSPVIVALSILRPAAAHCGIVKTWYVKMMKMEASNVARCSPHRPRDLVDLPPSISI